MSEYIQECQLCKKSYPETTFPPCDGNELCQNCYAEIQELKEISEKIKDFDFLEMKKEAEWMDKCPIYDEKLYIEDYCKVLTDLHIIFVKRRKK